VESFEPAKASSIRVDSVNPVSGVYVCEPSVPASYIMMSLIFCELVFSICCLSMTVTEEGMSADVIDRTGAGRRIRVKYPCACEALTSNGLA